MPAPFRWYPDLTRATATGAQTTNLGVNPISAVLLTIRAKVTAANTATPYSDILGLLSSISLVFDQEPFKVYTQLETAWVESILQSLWYARQLGRDISAANSIIQVTVPILFGRYLFDKDWALPARAAGRNQVLYTVNATSGNVSFVDLTIEELQMLGMAPKAAIKSIQSSFTPSGTGETDIFLSLEKGMLLGVLLRVTTAPAGTTQTGDIDWVRFLLNNEVWGYYQIYWETLHSDFVRKALSIPDFFDHTHQENTAAAYTQNALTRGPISGTAFDKYGYLDFDPMFAGMLGPDLSSGKDARQASVHPSYNTAAATRVLQRTLIQT